VSRMLVRSPTPGEVEVAADVASKAFPSLTHEHWQQSFHTIAEMFGERFILVVELDGRIVSSLLCCPAPIVVGQADVTHASVGAVGTLPELRRMGCSAAMMAECVKVLRDEGIHTSSLWPFSYEYYRKFGWEVGGETRAYRAKGSVFAEIGNAQNARAATPDDFEAISDCYHNFISNYNCSTRRTKDWWLKIARLPEDLKMIAEPGRGAVVHDSEGFVEGYAVYDIEAEEDRRSIEVKEIVHSSAQVRREMLALIGSSDPELEVTFTSASDDLFLHEIPNPRAVSVTVNPSFQFRITDPEGAMESLRTTEGVAGRFTLSISDPVFKHGWEFGVEAAKGKVALCKPDRSDLLDTDVQTLAKLYSGYLSPFDAWSMGTLRCHDLRPVVLACQVFASLRPYRSWLEPG